VLRIKLRSDKVLVGVKDRVNDLFVELIDSYGICLNLEVCFIKLSIFLSIEDLDLRLFIFSLKFIVLPSYFAELPYDNLFELLLLLVAFSLS
jgi:hypothetical protein